MGARLGAKTVDEHELAQAKVSFKAQLMFNMDGAHNSAKDLARQTFLFGRRVPLEEWFERIDDISAGNVHETLGHYVIHRRPVLSFYGTSRARRTTTCSRTTCASTRCK